MKKNLPLSLFLIIDIIVVTFVMSTTASLPEPVASHFNAAGMPDGFMSHKDYLGFMLAFAAGIPALIVLSFSLLLRLGSGAINIPHKEYWLSAQNKGDTLQFLQGHASWLGIIIASFVAYIHWLLLVANRTQPPGLPGKLVLIGMGILLASLLLWGSWLTIKFMRVPKV